MGGGGEMTADSLDVAAEQDEITEAACTFRANVEQSKLELLTGCASSSGDWLGHNLGGMFDLFTRHAYNSDLNNPVCLVNGSTLKTIKLQKIELSLISGDLLLFNACVGKIRIDYATFSYIQFTDRSIIQIVIHHTRRLYSPTVVR